VELSPMTFIFSEFCIYIQNIYKFHNVVYIRGAHGDAVGCGTALQAGRLRVRFPMGSLGFFIDFVIPAAIWRWGRLSL
jgi:hypothetical protein